MCDSEAERDECREHPGSTEEAARRVHHAGSARHAACHARDNHSSLRSADESGIVSPKKQLPGAVGDDEQVQRLNADLAVRPVPTQHCSLMRSGRRHSRTGAAASRPAAASGSTSPPRPPPSKCRPGCCSTTLRRCVSAVQYPRRALAGSGDLPQLHGRADVCVVQGADPHENRRRRHNAAHEPAGQSA